MSSLLLLISIVPCHHHFTMVSIADFAFRNSCRAAQDEFEQPPVLVQAQNVVKVPLRYALNSVSDWAPVDPKKGLLEPLVL